MYIGIILMINQAHNQPLEISATSVQYQEHWYAYLKQPVDHPRAFTLVEAMKQKNEGTMQQLMNNFSKHYVGHEACWRVKGLGWEVQQKDFVCNLDRHIGSDISISMKLPDMQSAHEIEVRLW
jgi:hypothetical protein